MRTKRLNFVLMMVAAALFGFTANALGQGAQLDPPHDAAFGTGCISCHDLAAFTEPNMIPGVSTYSGVDIDDTKYNSICVACHDGITATEAHTHSSLTTDNGYGDWSVECVVCHNQHSQDQDDLYGTTYGKFIRSNIDLSKIIGLVKSGNKPVKFTGPADFADGDANRNGICEVCHTQTLHFRNDDSLADEGTHIGLEGTDCMTCHVHGSGFIGGADHSAFIADDNETGNPPNVCSGCHNGYNTSPESAHSACTTCHTGTPPDLLDNTFASSAGQLDNDGADGFPPDYGTMYANLAAAGYSNMGIGRILDAEGDPITGAFTPIKCGDCHAAKPDALAAANHGGHAANHFAWDSNCDDCHSATPGAPSESVVIDIHANDCDLCHTGGTYDASTNGVGPAAAGNGIDGDAGLAEGDAGTWTASCTTCHAIAGSVDAATLGGIHHDNATVNVPNGLTDDGTICATCHSVAGHEGNHAARVAQEVGSCSVCHTGTHGDATGVPINAADMMIHDACGTCHQIAALPAANVELVAAPGTKGVTTMNPGTPATDDGGGTCTVCHTAYAFTDHTHTHNVTQTTPCDACHTGDTITATDAGQAPDQGTHQNDCANCHNTTSGARIVGANGWGDATVNGGAGGDCIDCHVDYFNAHVHGTTGDYVQHSFGTSAGCVDCHGNAVAGTNARDAITTPFVGAGEVHAPNCSTCHSGVDGSLVGSAAGNEGATECVDCHINVGTPDWESIHAAALGTVQPAVDHTTAVAAYAACLNCHVESTPTSNAREAITTPYTAGAEVHSTNGCTTCHTGANDGGFNAGPFAKADQIQTGGAGCYDCHLNTTAWKDRHAPKMGAVPEDGPNYVDHRTRVDGLAGCVTCHDTTAANGTTGVILVDGATGNKVHSDCYDCHNNTFGPNLGQLKAIIATGGSANIAKGDCGTCHSAGYFDSHTHHYGVNNELNYNAAVDLAQDAPGTPCASCHTNNDDASGTPLDSFTDILGEHVTGCARCHSYTDDGNATPPQADNDNSISTAGARSCISCHTPKIQPATHGGHNGFVWAGGCEACHGAGAGAEDVVTVIHSNNCDLCHTGGTYNAGTNGAGPAANGIDGDAGLAEGDAGIWASSCTTCHAIAGSVNAATLGGIHHENAGMGVVAVGDCATCHGVNGQEGDHTSLIGDAATCTSCHTGTAGGGAGTGAPVNAGDDQIHDTCLTCHAIAGATARDGYLLDFATADTHDPDWLAAMPNGGAGTNNGGGDCTACHGAYFDSHVHGQDGGYVDHTVSFNAATDLAQDAPGTPCDSCHLNNDDAAGTPLDSWTDILGEHVTGCARCHSYTDDGAGTPPQAANDNAIANNTVSTCITCHTPKEQPAKHGGHDATHFADYATGNTCTDSCHTVPATGVVEGIHNNQCTLCHTSASGGTGTAKVGDNGDGNALLGTGAAPHAGVSCITCHDITDANVLPASIGGIHHDTPDAVNNNCTNCHATEDHTASVNTEAAGANTLYGCATAWCHPNTQGTATTVPVSMSDALKHDACRTCHTIVAAPALNGILADFTNTKGVNGAGQLPATPNTCVDCHTQQIDTYHHTNANTPIGNCEYCHEDPRLTAPQTGYTKPPEVSAVSKPAALTGIPTQLFCIECHLAPEDGAGGGTNGNPTEWDNTRVNGWAGNTMTIIAHDLGSDARKTATSWRTAYPRTNVHAVPNTAAQINDWGICLGCHDGTANRVAAGAVRVDPFHAMPTTIDPARTDYCGTDDVTGNSGGTLGLGMYIPGRRMYNNISNVNFYGDYFKPRATRPRNTQTIRDTTWNTTERCADQIGNQTRANQITPHAQAQGRTMYAAGGNTAEGTTPTYDVMTIPDPWAGGTFANYYVTNWPLGQDNTSTGDNGGPDAPLGIPTFDIKQPITYATDQLAPAADDVKVVSAQWDGTDIIVVATNTDGCGALTVSVGGGSWVGDCAAGGGTYTVTAGYSATVDVTTSNTSGLSVYNYPVTDNSAPTPATANDDPTNPSGVAPAAPVLDVLANDTGSNLEVVVATVSAVSKISGAGTCGTVTPTTANITYNAGTGDADCQFTYEAQAYDGGPLGPPSTATVTVQQRANQPPAFGSPTYTASPDANVGVAYTSDASHADATDPESDPITYSRNGGTCSAGMVVAANGVISGTPVAGDAASCTIVVRATATGGFDEATVTLNVSAVAPYADWTETYTGAGDAAVYDGNGWLLTSGTTGTNYWQTDTDVTASGTGGPGGALSGPYAFVECSYAIADDTAYWLESPDLDASTYDFSLEFDYNLFQGSTATYLDLYVDDGAGFNKHGATLWTGLSDPANGGDANGWVHIGPIDLSAYTSATMRFRIQVHVWATGTNIWANDPAFDNIFVDGTP